MDADKQNLRISWKNCYACLLSKLEHENVEKKQLIQEGGKRWEYGTK